MGWLKDMFFGPKSEDETGLVEAGTQQSDETNEAAADGVNGNEPVVHDPYRDEQGRKIRPEVEIERVKVDSSGDQKRMEVWVFVKNNSDLDVEVTRVNFLSGHAAGCYLKAGAGREIRIYSGDTPTNNSYKTAQVQYKVVGSGDYFQADHYVEYQYEQTDHGNYYIPEEFKLTRPVRDI